MDNTDMPVPELHDFRAMLAHLQTGGGAYRYGSFYPFYVGRLHEHNGHKSFYIQMYSDGGSTGEWVSDSRFTGIQFSADEQHSINWVFVSREAVEKRDAAMKEYYLRDEERRAEEREAKETQKAKQAQRQWWRRMHCLISS